MRRALLCAAFGLLACDGSIPDGEPDGGADPRDAGGIDGAPSGADGGDRDGGMPPPPPLGPPPPSALPPLEGESMQAPTTHAGVREDPSASGAAYLLAYSNAAATGWLTGAGNRLVVRARGEACEGAPEMVVSLDDVVVGITRVEGTEWTLYSYAALAAPGSHRVTITFTNDYATGCDRNLHVDYAYLTIVDEAPSPPPSPPVGTLEGEASSAPSTHTQIVADGSASGGSHLLMFSNAAATGWLAGPGDRLVVRAAGDRCEGSPEMRVHLDGVLVGTTAVAEAAWTDYVYVVNAAPGAHRVAVSFTNDHTAAGCDRNLRVDLLSLQRSPWAVPFGSRPASGPIRLSGCSDVTIRNHTFRALGPNVVAIYIEGCERVTIDAVDFIDVAEGIYVQSSTDITVTNTRYSNILGPHERSGYHRGNLVQLNDVARARIAYNKGRGGDTEDIVSVYLSTDVVVEDNHFEGTDWTSSSGSGIALSDAGGARNVARRNILVNPGQVGMFIAGGTDSAMTDNIIIGERRPLSNVGLYVWNQYASPCSGHVVDRNRVHWLDAAGNPNPFWYHGNCGAVAGSENAYPDPSLDIDTHRVTF